MRTLALASCVAAVSVGGTLAADAALSSAHGPGAAAFRAGHHRLQRGIVHADLVVAAPDGTFKNVTVDRGWITAVNGSTISLREGTKSATYKTVDITVPTGVVVRVNRHSATLGDLKPGQRAQIAQLPKRTIVIARG
jgi:hypothetical protein